MRVIPADKAGIKEALRVLRAGGVVAHPTDTVFGLAADFTNPKAVRKVHAIKKSDANKSLLQITPTKSYLTQIAKISKIAKVLIKEFWPGGLALVLPAIKGGTVGVRYPAHVLSLALARGLKRPITTTSANLTGQATAQSAAAVSKLFASQKHQPDLILEDSEVQKAGKPSTIIDCTGCWPMLLRTGVVPFQKIQKVLRRQ